MTTMIESVLLGKKKMMLKLKNMSSGYIGAFYEENDIWDEAFIKANFEYIKEKYVQLLNSDQNEQYAETIKDLREDMILLASNSINNIDFAIQLSEKSDSYIGEALVGVYYYKIGEMDKSFASFHSFFNKRKAPLNHYLINKLYGLLLYEKGLYQEASEYLSIAVQKMPDDYEVYDCLLYCYKMMNDNVSAGLINNIIVSLKGE